ncbi:sensor histidine kinase [Lichenicoccus sp.]|uniref:sensor histidine kinase n=1 Tax=Lichenicoccus sp. TaxID=2781899 RepID=UPI003D0BE16F
MRSLRSRLWVLWSLTAAASVAVGLLLVQLYQSSNTAQLQRGQAVVARACDIIADRYRFYVKGWDGAGADLAGGTFGRALMPVLAFGLIGQNGVVGGIWSATVGPLAGTERLSATELAVLHAANQEAAESEQPVMQRRAVPTATLLLAACPLPGPISGLTAWTTLRVQGGQGFDRLRAGIAVLLVLVVGIAVWVAWLTASWARHVRTIETLLASHGIEELPRLPRTGERELDRIVAALNDAGARLSQARSRSAELAVQVAASERLAALGRVAAGIAHEIRNPIAAMRLRAENALAGDASRHQPALQASLEQIGRVDRLVSELLGMTRQRTPCLQPIDLPRFLEQRIAQLQPRAEAAGVRIEIEASDDAACFDPELIGRAVDNLLANALSHTPAGGHVRLRAEMIAAGLRITVADTGPGVDPALRQRLFEPFVTGRADGTGLGLAVAREMAEAHGGSLTLSEAISAEQGASFVLDLPQGAPCRPS